MPKKPKRETRTVTELIGRYRRLEAKQDEIVDADLTDDESDAAYRALGRRKYKIWDELSEASPQNILECLALATLAVREIRICDGIRCDGSDIRMIEHAISGLEKIAKPEGRPASEKVKEALVVLDEALRLKLAKP